MKQLKHCYFLSTAFKKNLSTVFQFPVGFNNKEENVRNGTLPTVFQPHNLPKKKQSLINHLQHLTSDQLGGNLKPTCGSYFLVSGVSCQSSGWTGIGWSLWQFPIVPRCPKLEMTDIYITAWHSTAVFLGKANFCWTQMRTNEENLIYLNSFEVLNEKHSRLQENAASLHH